MKQLLTLFIGLLVFTGATASARAQSGRNKPNPNADRSADSVRNPGSTDPNAVDPVVIERGVSQGETVEDDLIRVDTTLVTVPVSVRDRDGRYAPDLRREDFRLFEEGVEQRISYFAAVDQPFTVALLLDVSSSTDLRLEDMQNAAIAFVRQLKPEDRVLLIAFDDKVKVLAEPTSDRAALTAAIRRTRSGGSTRLYDAVDFVVKQRLQQITGRKAIVLFTDGMDTASRKASYKSTVRLAEELDALIYPVAYGTSNGMGPSGVSVPIGRGRTILTTPPIAGGTIPGASGGNSNDPESRQADDYLQELAQKSGGRFYRGGSLAHITQAFQWVAEELRRQYSLGYYPAQPGQDGQRRQLKVRVERANLVVLSRDSYIYSRKKTEDKEPEGKQFTQSGSRQN